jgi:hypothetical protein
MGIDRAAPRRRLDETARRRPRAAATSAGAKRSTTERSSRSSGKTPGGRSRAGRRRRRATLRGAARADVHVSQFAALDMRKVAKLVRKSRARWTAYGVNLTGKGEPR